VRRPIAAFSVLLLTSGVFAQELKIFGGADWARYQVPQGAIFEMYSLYRANPGFLAGVGLELPLLPFLSADIDLLYFEKGAKADEYYLAELIGYSTYNLNVISLPGCLKFKPLRKLPPYIIAGGELSYVLSHHYDFMPLYSLFDPPPSDLTPDTRRLDFGFVVGGGAEIAAGSRLAIFTELRYHVGLPNLGKPGILDFTTSVLAVQAGLKFSLSPKNR
jgi:hypothetical protein